MDREHWPYSVALLSVEQMYRADAAAMAAGNSGTALMEAAGKAVAHAVLKRTSAGDAIAVLCGPGNNGGDGFVAARLLLEAGRTVRLGLLGRVDRLSGDAAVMAGRWQGAVEPLSPALLSDTGLVVDALFGAGLTRGLDGAAGDVVRCLAASDVPVVAVDVPSGVDGDTGAVRGVAAAAVETVTFFRRKTGHLLLPGRALCGLVTVADIGIPEAVLTEIAPRCFANDPAAWRREFPWPRAEGHKYTRGHAVVQGGATATGAARLAAAAALRSGAGLVTIASPPEAAAVYRTGLASVIVREIGDGAAFEGLVGDPRVTALLVGPGNGLSATTRDRVLAALGADKRCVLDADGLSVFADRPEALFDAITRDCVLTPHEGEFRRLFGQGEITTDGDKLARTRAAAVASGAVVLLKGPDTVVADPSGVALINENAPPSLATAGAGDVLAGLITGLMAQGMPALDSAAAGAWLHGEAARLFGLGLIADDLIDHLPAALRRLADLAA